MGEERVEVMLLIFCLKFESMFWKIKGIMVEFIKACGTGDLPEVQRLYETGGAYHHANHEDAFHSACINGHLDVAKYLISLGGVDHHADHEWAFRWA